ncbi:type I glyceraldehyde-3-phosphate dehydrogenase [Sulfobacillus acidophilus]|uniref:Glyceraldehyde-3-phosphate dehydrogenase n=1 Tax=Sulfobacillus acidophilus TaxID=53633 RepID=A0ABS3AW67_9FIRM|nr:type I glyceraldehyde-3-phosphate dehydrogenase [Sulfobacillus acidophilus]
MVKRVAINGFGRIGRVVFRIINERAKEGKSDVVVHAINDLADIDTLAYLLKYDSVHGRFNGDVKVDGNKLVVNGKPIIVTNERDPARLPWKEYEIDTVLESTGLFLNREGAEKHLQAGAKRVLISAPTKGDGIDATICYGVNNEAFDSSMKVISTASCTTNCIVPIAKVLNDEFGIEKASVTTIHSYTNDQKVLDLPHKDKRRARAAALSMIPTTTGAAKAVALVLPELKGKFDGMAIRVPTPNVSLIDLVALLGKNTTAHEINAKLKNAALNQFKGIMAFSNEPLVSVDFLGTNTSSIVDGLSTKVLQGNFIKVLAWYDNEWGFANRAVDLLCMISSAD